jgi:phosphate transport system permease protein
MLKHVEPFLHDYFGWIPLFGGSPQQSGMLVAIVVLTIMIIPITSSICRELFVGVPTELEEGAIGLGATRWEMVKTVVIPTVRGGVVAAVILGLGRALGEAIAVSQVIGNFTPLRLSIFEPGDTLASRVANQYQGAVSNLHVASLIYLALILLAITFITNFTAQRVVKRFEFQRTGGS